MEHEGIVETALVKTETISLGTIQARSPAELVASATETATHLAAVIERQKLYSMIQGRKYVKCEGWTTLAVMMGVLPREVSNEPLPDGKGYLATVALVRVSDGVELTRATAECGSDEPTWANRPAFARRSMAATRATGKACRLAFSWVMQLSGYEVTPAEEMPADDAPRPARGRPKGQTTRREAQPPQPKGSDPAGSQTLSATFVNMTTREITSRKGNKITVYEFHAEDGTVYSTLESAYRHQIEAGNPEQLYAVEFTRNNYGDNKILKLTPLMEDAEVEDPPRLFADVEDADIPEEEKPF